MTCDFLVVGAGVAGLRAAIELAKAGRVLVVAKDSLRESSSEYAQGGIAAAVGVDDSPRLHEEDTLAAGDGLCDPEAVRLLVGEGPAAVQELIEWGAEFDREGSRLALGREGAHSRRRILHAHGDSTGREIARTLYHKAVSLRNVEFLAFSAVMDLLPSESGVAGVVACDVSTQHHVQLQARAVLLATGGFGRVFAHSTNPEVASGDGVAAAWRAGAELSDLEFVQFHPTVLAVEGAPGFLLSEALRGEGAYLRNASGERFMTRYHALAELAPRDVVSRAIVTEMERAGAAQVYLDLTHLEAEFVRRRFPRIYETCLRHGVDLTKEPAPVRPAAHYAMGGVRSDLEGRTSLPRLYAAGEVACTGVHGANRLASNSLLEALVFGARAGRAMRELAGAPLAPPAPLAEPLFPCISEEEVRRLSWRQCGIVRSGECLEKACRELASMPLAGSARPNRAMFELRSLHTVAWLVARCALARRESRGAHYRTDYAEKRTELQKHSRIRKDQDVTFC